MKGYGTPKTNKLPAWCCWFGELQGKVWKYENSSSLTTADIPHLQQKMMPYYSKKKERNVKKKSLRDRKDRILSTQENLFFFACMCKYLAVRKYSCKISKISERIKEHLGGKHQCSDGLIGFKEQHLDVRDYYKPAYVTWGWDAGPATAKAASAAIFNSRRAVREATAPCRHGWQLHRTRVTCKKIYFDGFMASKSNMEAGDYY